MPTHQLKPDAYTLHGDYSLEREPVLRIQSGDTIEAETFDAGWGLEAPHLDGTPRLRHPKVHELAQWGHALIGPIWIEGAKPGMTLVVHFEELLPGAYGFTYAGGFAHRIHQHLGLVEGGEELMLWSLDAGKMTGTNHFGHQIKLKPFLGNLGMPPPESGHHSTLSPSIWGGNIDCRELVAGTRLYLPVPVEGALFSFGDGHAAQGHGEVSVNALECPMSYVRLGLELSDTSSAPPPCAWTPAGWLTFGFHTDLEQATYIALDSIVSLLMSNYSLPSRKQALALATAVVDLHITQIANPVMGVHAFLPHDALEAT
ncbi:MAG: acetamidase/formamidase family protein [Chloroflexi bacterium]|nr:acetamidase/formamidase family protein [Chloroflexota bacterium]MCC6894308.1 acetamidase/formamidase family protein [Anaerolineae bacterium]